MKPITLALTLLAAVITYSATAEDDPTNNTSDRLREGTMLEVDRGQFAIGAERVTFTLTESQRQFIVLENLGLQRVVDQLQEDQDVSFWLVSGKVTEFRGANFLLLTRATVAPTVTASLGR